MNTLQGMVVPDRGAVENAVYCTSEALPAHFVQGHVRADRGQRRRSERADIIQTLYAINGRSNFTAISLHEHLAESAREAEAGIAGAGNRRAAPVLHRQAR